MIDWDGGHRAARGWDLNGAGWDFCNTGGDLYDTGGNLDGDDRGSGADDRDATCVDDFIAGVCHGDSACVWDRRAAGDGGNWGGVYDSGRNVRGRVAIFSISMNSFKPAKSRLVGVPGGTVQDGCRVDGFGQSARAVRDGQGGRLSDNAMS